MQISIMRTMAVASLALSLCAFQVHFVGAQPAVEQFAGSTVQAYGEHVQEVTPEKIRMVLIAKAEGATAKEAIERLGKHKASVRTELLAMKAEEASIKFTSSEVTHHLLGVPTQYQHLNTRMISNLLEGAANIRMENWPVVYVASCFIEADWVLAKREPDFLMQLPNTLREEAEKRDLIGDDNAMELSPEQTANIEKFRTALDENMGFYDDPPSKDNRVQVLFVANISTATRAEALKSAFEKAREECQLLATASGNQLGRMVSLSKVTPDDQSNDFSFSAAIDSSDALMSRIVKAARRDEVISRQADSMQARFQVRAVFKLQ